MKCLMKLLIRVIIFEGKENCFPFALKKSHEHKGSGCFLRKQSGQ